MSPRVIDVVVGKYVEGWKREYRRICANGMILAKCYYSTKKNMVFQVVNFRLSGQGRKQLNKTEYEMRKKQESEECRNQGY